MYAYVGGNPVSYQDSLGHSAGMAIPFAGGAGAASGLSPIGLVVGAELVGYGIGSWIDSRIWKGLAKTDTMYLVFLQKYGDRNVWSP